MHNKTAMIFRLLHRKLISYLRYRYRRRIYKNNRIIRKKYRTIAEEKRVRHEKNRIIYEEHAAKYRAKGQELLAKAQELQLKSYSQYWEDSILYYLLFEKLGLKKVSYLDLGCFDPIEMSNTYLFYTMGMRGVCVDANPSIEAVYKKIRPKDRFVNSGISIEEDGTELDFYIMNSKAINTFVKEEVDIYVAKYGYKLEDTIKVKIKSINTIIDEYCQSTPELLSTDIDGLDAKVLMSLDFEKYRPKIIITETGYYCRVEYDEVNKLVNFMKQKGYEVMCETGPGVNTIFMDKRG